MREIVTEEQKRISENYSNTKNWLKWGPYLSERQWATVREDYSPNGDVWNYSHMICPDLKRIDGAKTV
jgi:hypothetical protein